MTRHRKFYVCVETKRIEGIELSSLGRYPMPAMSLFGKLNRFGRVAVDADQAWVRWDTRAASALRPFIGYRTYLRANRDKALAWVDGRNPADWA